MGNQILIDDEGTVAIASELAALTGESLGSAVATALSRQLAAERQNHDRARRLAEVLTIAAEIRASLPDPKPTSDHSYLYDDETGLPI